MNKRIPTINDFINEAASYVPFHSKCKSKFERKLMSINELRIGEVYMIVLKGKKDSAWTDGWELKSITEEPKTHAYTFISKNDLYDIKELKLDEFDLETMIFDRYVAKQK